MQLSNVTGVTEHSFEIKRHLSHLIVKTDRPIGDEQVFCQLTNDKGSDTNLIPNVRLQTLAEWTQYGTGAIYEVDTTPLKECYYAIELSPGNLQLNSNEELMFSMSSMSAARTYTFFSLEAFAPSNDVFDYTNINISEAVEEEIKQTTQLTGIILDPAKVTRIKFNYVDKLTGRSMPLTRTVDELKYLSMASNDISKVTKLDAGTSVTYYNGSLVVSLQPKNFYCPTIEITTNGETLITGVEIRNKYGKDNRSAIASTQANLVVTSQTAQAPTSNFNIAQ